MNLRSEVTLSELYANPSRNGIYKSAEFHGSGLKIVNMGELFGYDFISNQDMKRVQLTDKELENFSLQNGDLLFGRRSLVEAGAGKCSIVFGIEEPLTFESSIIRVRLNNKMANPRFYFYYFKSPQGSGRIHSIVTGTNVKGIRGTELGKLKVLYLPITAQDTIVRILSAYDTIIENNCRRIQLLEQSARLLYREWFVYLRFPGHEHVRIIDGVPEGWYRDKVENIIGNVHRKKKIKKEDYLNSGKIPCVDQSREFIGGYTNDEDAVFSEQIPIIVFGDHTRVLKFIDFPFASGADGTQLIIPKNDRLTVFFLFFSLDAIDLSNYFYARHFKFLKEKEVLIPTKNLVKEFTEFVQPNMNQINKLKNFNIKLSRARDLLLPRLMTGAITV